MDRRLDHTTGIGETARQCQEAARPADALRLDLGQVVAALGAEAGTTWFYNVIVSNI